MRRGAAESAIEKRYDKLGYIIRKIALVVPYPCRCPCEMKQRGRHYLTHL